MKRYSNLYEKISSFENLYLASREARLGKRGKESCASFELNIEEELHKLCEEMACKTYRPGAYREFTVYERKPRKISAAPYRDRVVHHALCRIVEPVFEKSFIHDSYACRVGRGTHAAVNRFTQFCRTYRYALKTDIRKYFPSIDHEILLAKISKKIKCKDTLWLTGLIIDGSNKQEEIIDYFPGDDLFTPFARRRGIPIGNLTSQFFANIYLNDFDHFIKEKLQYRAYIRYVDDMVFFAHDKRRLWQTARQIEEYLSRERLSIHRAKTTVSPCAEGIDFLGYRVYPDHRRIRRDNAQRFERKLRKMAAMYQVGCVSLRQINASVQSWIGHTRHADTFALRKKIFDETCFSRN